MRTFVLEYRDSGVDYRVSFSYSPVSSTPKYRVYARRHGETGFSLMKDEVLSGKEALNAAEAALDFIKV